MITAEELDKRFGAVDAQGHRAGAQAQAARAARRRALRSAEPGADRAPPKQVVALGIPAARRARCWSSGSAATASRSRRAFTKLFLKELWEPFEQAGQPDERWDELIEAVGSLRAAGLRGAAGAVQAAHDDAAGGGVRQSDRAPGQAQVGVPGAHAPQAGACMHAPETCRMRHVLRTAHAPFVEAAHVRPRGGVACDPAALVACDEGPYPAMRPMANARRAAARPGTPCTAPPGKVAALPMYRPRTGVR